MTMQDIIGELQLIFDNFNARYFEDELKATITIQSKGKLPAYGWCTNIPVWIREDEEHQHEINLSAEYMSRPYMDIAETILHEMIHLEASRLGVQDTSRQGRYHNRKYKELAEKNGLEVEKDIKFGYCRTSLKHEVVKVIESWDRPEVFKTYRIDTSSSSTTKKKISYKHTCPICQAVARSTKEIHLMCIDCDEPMNIEVLNKEDEDD